MRKEQKKKLQKWMTAGVLTGSLLLGTGVFAGAQDADGEFFTQIQEGTQTGVLEKTEEGQASADAQLPEGISMDLKGTLRGAAGADGFWEEEEYDEGYDTLEDWKIKVPIPEQCMTMLDGSKGEYYIYTMGQGIPYVMIMPFETEETEEEFLYGYTEYMRENYGDLQVIGEIEPIQIGAYDCWQTKYEYSIDGYQAIDRRVIHKRNGTIYLFVTKEVPELDLTIGNLLEETIQGTIFLEEETEAPQDEILTFGGSDQNTGTEQPLGNADATAFKVSKVTDLDTGNTIARMYAPADYSMIQNLMFYGDGNSTCSPFCPWQLVLVADSPDMSTEMLYCSRMSYIYSEQNYVEGSYLYGLAPMLVPMTASAYADFMVQSIFGNVGDIYVTGIKESTPEEESYLQNRAQQIFDYYQDGLAPAEKAVSTYIEKEYSFEQNGQSYSVLVVTATDMIQYTMGMNGWSDTFVQMDVPYVYVLATTTEQLESHRENFELFLSNTRVTDEFAIATQMLSQELVAAMSAGTNPAIDDQEIAELLGTEDGSFTSEEFCDYIRSQETYTTTEGKIVKVPNSFDYVYEGTDGKIYATDSADFPSGSTRLYQE